MKKIVTLMILCSVIFSTPSYSKDQKQIAKINLNYAISCSSTENYKEVQRAANNFLSVIEKKRYRNEYISTKEMTLYRIAKDILPLTRKVLAYKSKSHPDPDSSSTSELNDYLRKKKEIISYCEELEVLSNEWSHNA